MRCRGTRSSALILGLLTGVGAAAGARADGPAPPPTSPPPTSPPPPASTPPPPASGYPTALTARPLLLPAGGVEGGVRLVTERYSTSNEGALEDDHFVFLDPHVRYGLGQLELEAGARVFLFDDVSDTRPFVTDPERLAKVDLAARYGLDADTALAVELTAYTPTGDYSSYQPTVSLRRKLHLAPRAAVVSDLGAGVALSSYDDGMTTNSTRYFLLGGRTRAQAQVAPTVALEAGGRLQYTRQVSDSNASSFTYAALEFRVELGAVVAITRDVDAVAAIELVSASSNEQKTFTIGVVARRIP